jgi:hypothetical protein
MCNFFWLFMDCSNANEMNLKGNTEVYLMVNLNPDTT